MVPKELKNQNIIIKEYFDFKVDPEIRKWMKDLPESSVIEARSMLAKFEASRDETRNLRDLYQVYREQIRRLERAWRRGEKSGSDMFTSEPNPEGKNMYCLLKHNRQILNSHFAELDGLIFI